MKNLILAFLFCFITLSSFGVVTPYPKDKILYLSGSSQEMGREQGKILKDEIQVLIKDWLVPRLKTVPFLIEYYANEKANQMLPFISDDMKAEMKALSEASGIDYMQVVIANAVPDIMELVYRPFSCSTIAVLPERSYNGKLLFGRNLDYSNSDILRKYWRPTVFARTGKLKVFSLNLPGMSGVLTAINEKGVSLSRMTSYSVDIQSKGIPTMLLFRSILENANTAEEAAEMYLKEKNRTVAINVMITDANTARVLEVTAHNGIVRTPNAAGVLYAANHFEVLVGTPFGKKDERWPILASFDNTTEKISEKDTLSVLSKTGLKTKNILSTFIDYKNQKLLFGSEESEMETSAHGPLYSIDLNDVFSRTTQ